MNINYLTLLVISLIYSNVFTQDIRQCDLYSLGIDIITTSNNCYGKKNGRISIINIEALPDSSKSDKLLFQFDENLPLNYSNNREFNKLPSGNYTIYVKQNDTVCYSKVALVDPEKLVPSIIEETKPSSNTSEDGAIFINVEGGTPNYIYYLVDGSGSTLPENGKYLINLSPGDYSVLFSDDNGCEVSSPLLSLIAENPYFGNCTPLGVNNNCNSNPEWSIKLDSAKGPYNVSVFYNKFNADNYYMNNGNENTDSSVYKYDIPDDGYYKATITNTTNNLKEEFVFEYNASQCELGFDTSSVINPIIKKDLVDSKLAIETGSITLIIDNNGAPPFTITLRDKNNSKNDTLIETKKYSHTITSLNEGKYSINIKDSSGKESESLDIVLVNDYNNIITLFNSTKTNYTGYKESRKKCLCNIRTINLNNNILSAASATLGTAATLGGAMIPNYQATSYSYIVGVTGALVTGGGVGVKEIFVKKNRLETLESFDKQLNNKINLFNEYTYLFPDTTNWTISSSEEFLKVYYQISKVDLPSLTKEPVCSEKKLENFK